MTNASDARQTPRVDTDYSATVRFGGRTALFGKVVNLSRGGACIEFPRPMPAEVGQWLVLAGEGPLANGYDARVVHVADNRWRLAFDPTLIGLSIFGRRLTAGEGQGGARLFEQDPHDDAVPVVPVRKASCG